MELALANATEQTDTVPTPDFQNVVATFCMTQPGSGAINLSELAMKAPFVEFNAKRFAAAVLRLVKPKTTCLIFASGKGVCTGAKNETEARIAALKYVSLLRRTGMQLDFLQFKVQNVVSVVHCNFKLDLAAIASECDGWVNYEPRLFPGLMYRVKTNSADSQTTQRHVIVFICFQSGKCVITGGKSRSQVLQCWRKFYNDVILQHVAAVDYGTSGNYRVAQFKETHTAIDHDLLQKIAFSELPGDKQDLQNKSDRQQILISQNAEMRAVSALVRYVSDTRRLTLDAPCSGRYSPVPLGEH